ncbi:transglycosylase SLT domain-containing protein [Glaesserella sp.]|uniref:transglycosylase SLT domain-containing protein n=1 Tax=Glaesserella sp. TaxID=2094731 RepID=UPI0035A18A11
MMWKKTVIAFLISGSFAWASTTDKKVAPKMWTDAEVAQLQQLWQFEQSQHNLQRENFLQLESLLRGATRQGNLSLNTLALVNQLMMSLKHYPLKEDAEWALLRAKIDVNQVTDDELNQFIEQYPSTAKRNNLAQLPYERFYQQQKFEELIAYAKTVPPANVENQCRFFSAQFQLLAEQLQPNPEAEQAGNTQSAASQEMAQLVQQFDRFWQGVEDNDFWINGDGSFANYWKTNADLPSDCSALEAYWRDQGLKTSDKVRKKVVGLFNLNGKKAIEAIIANNQDAALGEWLKAVQKLLNDPTYLQTFVQNQPLESWNKALILKTFPGAIRALPEQMETPDFSIYQRWAEQWKFSANEIREWKITFLNRFFDNTNVAFQTWRDQQILELKADNLTERRLRMAIWQKTDLRNWLNVLSADGKNKAEWRYWLAKVEPSQKAALLEQLSKERGFYPMLAAHQLNKTYQVTIPEPKKLTEQQKNQYRSQLERIAELRRLARYQTAKTVWIELLKTLSFEEKLALSDYAQQQDWFDLAVEATIQAKAWDYISLRLPQAYSDWFDIALANKTVTKSFAMAIARQESAWDVQARSHANAIGLMQMLGSTAEATAKLGELPYGGEADLINPFRNIVLGTTHLSELNAKYPDNRILIASAYNAGPHRVTRWLERAGGKLEMDEFIASIPFLETRGYVQNVLAYDYYYQILQQKTPLTMFYPAELKRY